MAQINTKGGIDARQGSGFEQFNSDEEVSLTTTYVSKLRFDAIFVTESVISFKNNSGVQTLLYKIFGSVKSDVDLNAADPEVDPSWINLLSPDVYNHAEEKSIPVNSRGYQSFVNPWKWIIVMIKCNAATTTGNRVYHRGES